MQGANVCANTFRAECTGLGVDLSTNEIKICTHPPSKDFSKFKSQCGEIGDEIL